jgi:NTP pyrophosphatase (non-canonical NTP hydrolase)
MAFTPRCLEELRAHIQRFADEREWQRFHTPRNLLLAVMSEVGEAAEILRWQGEGPDPVPADQRQAWAEELADIFILLVRLADRSGVDLGTAVPAKLARAAEKYPVERFKGSNRKYDA